MAEIIIKWPRIWRQMIIVQTKSKSYGHTHNRYRFSVSVFKPSVAKETIAPCFIVAGIVVYCHNFVDDACAYDQKHRHSRLKAEIGQILEQIGSKGVILPLVHWLPLLFNAVASVRSSTFPNGHTAPCDFPRRFRLVWNRPKVVVALLPARSLRARQTGWLRRLPRSKICNLHWHAKLGPRKMTRKRLWTIWRCDYRKTEIVVHIMPVFYRVLSYSTKILDSITLREPIAGNLKFVFLNLTAASNVNINWTTGKNALNCTQMCAQNLYLFFQRRLV